MLYDGMCVLCSGIVEFILAHDRDKRFRFAPLDSIEARAVLHRAGDPTVGEAVALVEGRVVRTRSTAVLRIAGILGGAWWLLVPLAWIPVRLRDRIYDWIASRRGAWFGTRTTCHRVPVALRPEPPSSAGQPSSPAGGD